MTDMSDDYPLVPQFRELTVPGGQLRLPEPTVEMERRLEPPWERAFDTEGDTSSKAGDFGGVRDCPMADGPRGLDA
jgi:hypothetical protein